MDCKIILNLDEQVRLRAEKYAADNHITLDKLIEDLLYEVTSDGDRSLENMPISAWVSELAEGPATHGVKRSRQASKKSFYEAHK